MLIPAIGTAASDTSCKPALLSNSHKPTPKQEPIISTRERLAALIQPKDLQISDRDPALSLSTADISFFGYRFVRTEFLHRLRQSELKYLEDRACFRLPRREILQEILNEFFRYLHPLVPLFNEAKIQAMCNTAKSKRQADSGETLSLFEVQSILFAASSFVKVTKLHQLGFESVQHAQRCLYHRAKVMQSALSQGFLHILTDAKSLYSFETDTCPISLSRGCLLLSLWCSPDHNHRTSNVWLASAIQYARDAQLHYGEQPTHALDSTKAHLKRLIWSCLLRDRMLSLGLRQPIQITRPSFDWEGRAMTMVDIGCTGSGEDDGDCDSSTSTSSSSSNMWDRDIKQVLILLTVALAEFSNLLPDMLALIKLCQWNLSRRLAMVPVHQRSPGPVTRFSCLLNIYYYSTLVLLTNFELGLQVENSFLAETEQDSISRLIGMLRMSIISLADTLRELFVLDLLKYLPFSAIACLAQSLVIHLLDPVLGESRNPNTSPEHHHHQSDLAIVLQAMKICQALYQKATNVLLTAHFICCEAQSVVGANCAAITSWEDFLTHEPRAYLRFVRMMDLTLAKGGCHHGTGTGMGTTTKSNNPQLEVSPTTPQPPLTAECTPNCSSSSAGDAAAASNNSQMPTLTLSTPYLATPAPSCSILDNFANYDTTILPGLEEEEDNSAGLFASPAFWEGLELSDRADCSNLISLFRPCCSLIWKR
ncbi:hypothetical protein BJX64DRAFT_291748 [Aspergillus heterothallicus]